MTVQPNSPSDTDNPPNDPAPAGDPPNQPPAEDNPPAEPDYKAEAEKWKALSRKHESRANENAKAADELKELKDADKSDSQKQAEALTSAQSELEKTKAENMRLKVALEKAPEGMPLSKVTKLAQRLTGDTQEELEQDAEELFADFAPAGTEGGKEGGERRRPTERLKPGTVPGSEPEETDPAKLAAKVPRRY